MKIDFTRSVTLISCMLVVLGVFARELYVPLLPNIADTLPGNHFFSTSIIAATIGGIGISLLFYGPFSDAIGRKITLIFGISIATISTICSVFVTNSITLWVMQVLCGIGIGACVVISRSILRDGLESDSLTRAISFQSMASSIFPVFAPLVGAFFQETYGWRSVFILFASIVGLTLIVVCFYLPETNNHQQKSLCRMQNVIDNYFLVLKNKFFIRNVLLMSFSFLPLILYSLFSSFIFQIEFHTSVKISAIFYGITTIGYFFGSLITNRLCHKLQSKTLLRISLYLPFVAAFFMLIFAVVKCQNVLTVCIPMFFVFMGCGILTPIASKECIQPFPTISGSATALVYSIRMLIPAFFAALFILIGLKTQLSIALYVASFALIALVYNELSEKFYIK